MNEIDIVDNSIPISKVEFILNPLFWNDFNDDIKNQLHSVPIWDEAKFLDDRGKINPEMSRLPNKAGGIYLFVAKPNLIPNTHSYLMYVGRAHCSNHQNLRKRCREYIKVQKRPKITRMINTWGQYLYVRYLPLTDNDLIDDLESEIISKILPPFNDSIPNKQIRNAVKAFSV